MLPSPAHAPFPAHLCFEPVLRRARMGGSVAQGHEVGIPLGHAAVLLQGALGITWSSGPSALLTPAGCTTDSGRGAVGGVCYRAGTRRQR